MVVHHASRLHVRITDRRSHECEASLAQIFAHRIRLSAGGGIIFQSCEFVHNRPAVHKSPDVAIEAFEFRLDFKKSAGVIDRGSDFRFVTDNSGIHDQLLDFPLVIAGNLGRIEMVEGEAVVFPFSQDGIPTQPGLSGFQGEKFE